MIRVNRRHFLMGSLAVAATAAGRTRTRAAGANDRVVVASMGLRGRGHDLLKYFGARQDVAIAYLADVDSRGMDARINEAESINGRKPAFIDDFRRALDDKSVDAIVMATPDHWHALGTILACQAGKDVYVEKPTSHSIWESRQMVNAARKYNRVVQVGAQNRSAPYVAEAIDYVRSGKLGTVHFAKVFNSKPRSTIGKRENMPTPEGVNYDMWLGPAPLRPFNENHFHYAWHWFWNYSGGDIINDGIHQMDMARWLLNRPIPKSVLSTGGMHFFQDDQETPDTHVAAWDYDGLTLAFEQTLWTPYQQKTPFNVRDRDVLPKWPFSGTRVEIYGSKQWLMLGRHSDGWEAYDGDFKTVAFGYGRQANEAHIANFLDCVRTREKPNADIEPLHQSTLLCHYANIAYRVGRKLHIDPKTEGFIDDAEANALVRRTYREPWVVPDLS